MRVGDSLSRLTLVVVVVIELGVFVITNGLTIDNQLTVIRNDCYERMAIGEKLNLKDVYKTLTVNTVPDCQMACTQEGEECKTFSFGVSVKGNSTCELSSQIIKETPDLKPIGTVSDVDFDLYIKKLGCKLVVTQNPATSNTAFDKPLQYISHGENPINANHQTPSKHPYYYDKPTSQPYGSSGQKVQSTLISIASGPSQPTKPTVPSSVNENPNDNRYHPHHYHEYGTGRPYYPNPYTGPNHYDFFDDRPPFRPLHLNHPYHSRLHYGEGVSQDFNRYNGLYFRPHRPFDDLDLYGDNVEPNDVHRYGSNRPYGPDFIPEKHQAHHDRPLSDYGVKPYRPSNIPERPVHQEPPRPPHIRPLEDDYNKHRPYRPPEIPDRPSHVAYDDPPPNRPYGGPLGSGYDEARPHKPLELPNRPSDAYPGDSYPHRPPAIPNRPSNVAYDEPPSNRPHGRPPGGGYDESRPHKPLEIPNRPSSVYSGDSYHHRPPEIPDRPSHVAYDEPPPPLPPSRPHGIINRPPGNGGYDESRPHKPLEIPNRPSAVYSGDAYPHRPLEIPDRPSHVAYDEPPPSLPPSRPHGIINRPSGDGGYDESRPHKPLEIPNRPSGPYRPPEIPNFGYDHSRPHIRPSEIPHRPLYEDYDQPRPEAPSPLDGDYAGPRPNRPFHIPDRPLVDGYDDSRPHRPHHRPPAYFEGNNDEERPYPPIKPYRPNYIVPERPSVGYNGISLFGAKPLSDDRIYGYGSYGNRRVGYYGGYRLRPYDSAIRHTSNSYNVTIDHIKGKPTEEGQADNKTASADGLQPLNSTENGTRVVYGVTKISPGKPIVTHTKGPNGEVITSIITEITEACFRRVLAGKRVVRALVRRTALCERLEDCQRECSDEKRFVCEGFNYRLDPTGRAQGECELLDLPLSRLDIRRDVYDDSDYDFYERDRNNDAPDCKGHYKYQHGSYGDYGYYQSDNKYYDYYDYYGHGTNYYDDSYRRKDGYKYNYRQPRPDDDYDDGYGYYYNDNRRGEYDFRSRHNQDGYDSKYDKPPPPPLPPRQDDYKPPSYPPPSYDYKSYEPYLPHGYWKYETPAPFNSNGEYWRKYFDERMKDKSYWGFNKHVDNNSWGNYGGSYGNFGAPDSYYFHNEHHHRNSNRHDYGDYHEYKYSIGPNEYGGFKDWGQYGGSYGYGGRGREEQDNKQGSYDYWGFSRFDNNGQSGLLPPYADKPQFDGVYLPPFEDGHDYLDLERHHHDHPHDHHKHKFDYRNFYKDECSLRMVTGFRLHKGIVKKLIAVPTIYECELLCFKEKDFPCTSYAYRYTVTPSGTLENCYLSDRNYKELDYYTDLEPDRNCDVYTMHNQNRCEEPINTARYNSDCFWRVRSGQRLDQRVVRDSLNVKSIVECQLECLRSTRFTCRGFSFRYGSPVIGGAIDNCQLTDWPFLDLDPRVHLLPEPGFELYERGSYGHGCEPYHFYFEKRPGQDPGDKMDQICYLGYGSPAKLLPQATKKSITVETEAECKAECTKAREKSLFQCMSLSYRTLVPRGSPNCDLSDIVQRDLLSNIDYVEDPESWLFAWDIHNPRCIQYIAFGNEVDGSGGPGSSGGLGGGSGIKASGDGPRVGGEKQEGFYGHGHTGKGTILPWFSGRDGFYQFHQSWGDWKEGIRYTNLQARRG